MKEPTKENLKEENATLRKFLNQYQEEANALKSYETYKVWLNNEYRKENEKLKQYLLNIGMIIEELEQQYDDIKDFTEIKDLKEVTSEAKIEYENLLINRNDFAERAEKYRQALEEIREVVLDFGNTPIGFKVLNIPLNEEDLKTNEGKIFDFYTKLNNKINEVLNDRN